MPKRAEVSSLYKPSVRRAPLFFTVTGPAPGVASF